MNRIRFSILVFVVVVACAEDFTGKVVGITDGDTIRFMHDGAPEKIRLWGIDCLESKQAFGTRAKQFTGDLSFGKVVKVRVRNVDRYHRPVAEIILPDGKSLNQELVRAGFAWLVSAVCPA